MNIFNKIALQGLRKNRTRTIVTIIGVVLSSLMITGVTTFGVSLLDYMARGAMEKYGDWNVAFLDSDPSFVKEQLKDEEAKDTVVFENIGYSRIYKGQNPQRPYFFIAGFSEEAFAKLRTTLLSGRLPENDGEILISGKAAVDDSASYKLGDTLSLAVGSRIREGRRLTQADAFDPENEVFSPEEEKTYTIVGICRTPVFETEASPGYTLITRNSGEVSQNSLFVTLKNPRKVYSYVERVKGGRTCIFNYEVLRFMGQSKDPGDKVFMTLLYSFGGIVLMIIMVGSVFLIYNSFSISLNERIREIGVLASVGATSKQLRNSVLFEGFCIGVLGIPVGVLAGLGGIGLVLSVVSEKFRAILYSKVALDMKISGFAVGLAVAVSMVTILISAYIPARRAVNLPVMECIRQTNEIKTEAGSMRISRRKQRIFGLEGTLALKNFRRNRKRYRSIVLSLVLSIVLFVATNALIDIMQQTAGDFKTVSDYDVGFGTQDMGDEELIRLFDKMKKVSGVTEQSLREVISCIGTMEASSLSDAYWDAYGERSLEETVSLPLEVHFFDDEFYQKMVQSYGLPADEYTGQSGKMIAVAKMKNDSDEARGPKDLEDMFRKPLAELVITPKMEGVQEGGEVSQIATVKEPGQNVSVTVAEVVPPDIPPLYESREEEELPYTLEILAPWSAKERLAPDGPTTLVKVKGMCFLSDNPSQTTAELGKIIQEEGITASYLLLNSKEAFEQFRNYIFIANVFAYTFIAIISLIAVANVFNTISTNIRLRKRELAMLRSVGMSDKDFNKMMGFECAFYGMKALMLGIPLSLLLSALIVRVMAADEVKFTLPWASVGISILSVFLIIFVTMMYAVSKIRKENIIDALRDEMT